MGISANTLFHFTSSDSLKKILVSQFFYPSYSLEHFENILPRKSLYRKAYIPIVCFCDLTITQLSQLSRHTGDFGKYGIGLKKDWGEKKGVSPVVYVHNKSYPSTKIQELIKVFNAMSTAVRSNDFYSDIRNELVDFFKYIKPYKGRWQKNKKFANDIRYYDEREWRYCPAERQFKVFSGIRKSDIAKVQDLNLLIKKDGKLNFTADDVKYIILDKRSEINDFFIAIDKMKIGLKKRNELKTKIITFDEIKDDF